MTDLEGLCIRDYRIQKKLGMGAMGAVYRVCRLSDDAVFAMKLMSWEMSADAHMVERFRMESEVLSRIRHPNLVRIFDYGQLTDGRFYYIMEHLEGETLAARMHRKDLTLGEILHFLRQLCMALDAIHRQGVVHRDLKPSNLFLAGQEPDVVLKLLDFGIAKIPGNGETHELTSTGAILGTPVYMSPEQALAQNFQVTHLSDIYAMGVITYKCLCGNFPIMGRQVPEVVAYHLLQEPIPISQFNSAIPEPIERVVMRCLSKRPLERFGSALDFWEAFETACREVSPDAVFVVRSLDDPDLLVSTHPWMNASIQKGHTLDCNPVEYTTALTSTDVTPSPENAWLSSGNPAAGVLPFVNRQKERQALRAFLDTHQVCSEITGPPGIGKTELVRQFLSELGGTRRIHCVMPDPEGMMLSWQPAIKLWRTIAGLPDDCRPKDVDAVCAAWNLPGEIAQALHYLMFGADFPHNPGVCVLRRELSDRLALAICLAAGQQNCILFFDDFDGYDAMTQNVIRRVIAIAGAGLRILVTGTVAQLFHDPDLVDRVVSMELGPLGPGDAQALVQQVHPGGVDARARALLDCAGGHPAHLVQGLRLQAEDAFGREVGWKEILRRRCAILPPAQRRLLAWVAVLGGQAPLSFIRDSGFLEETSRQAVACCMQKGLLESFNDGLRLSVPELLPVLLENMLPALRRQMKLLLLEYLRQGNADPRILAFHSDGVEEPAATAELYAACARAARLAFDDATGARFWMRFIDLMGEGGWETCREQLLDAHWQAAKLHRFLGDFHTASNLLQKAILHCSRQEAFWVRLHGSLARCLVKTEPAAALELVRMAMQDAENFDEPQLWHCVSFDAGKIALQTERFHEGILYLDAGIHRIAGGESAGVPVWELERLMAQCQLGIGLPGAALETIRGSLQRAVEFGNVVAQARLCELETRIRMEQSDFPGASDAALRAVAALRVIGDRHALLKTKLLLARLQPENLAWAEDAMLLARFMGCRNEMRQDLPFFQEPV